ncbi:MAG: FRG domain-containing protein [Saprospiraceae bacterium]|nr:FRG domain-containing protein [Saprospiraceae bacterium]
MKKKSLTMTDEHYIAGSVSSLAEFVKLITDLLKEDNARYNNSTLPIYRGHSNSDYELLPGLYRGGENAKWKITGQQGYWEREMLRDFKLLAQKQVKEQFVMPANDLEWLFIMQHYGMPTRLLDWTESYLVALYFAVLDAYENTDANAAVWMLDAWDFNQHFMKQRSIPSSSDERMVSKYVAHETTGDVVRDILGEPPVVLRANKATPRIAAQKGLFTIHGRNAGPLLQFIETINNERKTSKEEGLLQRIFCKKIIILGSYKKEILKDLYCAGISHSVLFPEVEGICRELKYRYSTDFIVPSFTPEDDTPKMGSRAAAPRES